MKSWRLAFASATGTSHIKTGKECQDFCSVTIIKTADDEVLIASVADGAGSAERSATGSKVVSEKFLALCMRLLASGASFGGATRTVCEGWVNELRESIVELAADEGLPVRDFATTFLGAIVGDSYSIFLQIGDGAIVVSELNSPEDYSLICWPQHGEYANTTSFLTDIDALANIEITIVQKQIARIAIFTDGLERLLLDFENHCAANRALDQLMRPLNSNGDSNLNADLRIWLQSAAVNARTDDDKSLVLASRI